MAAIEHTCIEVRCDGCGHPLEYEDHIPHFDNVGDGLDAAKEYDWIPVRDGKVFCTSTSCQLQAPSCACADEDMCDPLACPPGCPCLLHEEIVPLAPCENCGQVPENHGARLWHKWKHEQAEVQR